MRDPYTGRRLDRSRRREAIRLFLRRADLRCGAPGTLSAERCVAAVVGITDRGGLLGEITAWTQHGPGLLEAKHLNSGSGIVPRTLFAICVCRVIYKSIRKRRPRQSSDASCPKRRSHLVERLFAQHRGALQAFFYRRIKAKHDAADLVQEVYLRILRVKDADAIRNPEGYLYTVASNLVYEHSILNRRQAVSIDPEQLSARERTEHAGGLRRTLRSGNPRGTPTGSLGPIAAQVPGHRPLEISTRLELPGNRRAAGSVAAHGAKISRNGPHPLSPAHGANELMP